LRRELSTAVGQLHQDRNRKSGTRVSAVVKVVPVVIVDINVIGVVPVVCPVFWPGIQEQKRKASVREARIAHVKRGKAAQPEVVLASKIKTEGGLRNLVAAIASTLHPGAMLAFPLPSTTLPPCATPLPAAPLLPSSLLLPFKCLLPRALRFLLLTGLLRTLRLLHLLSALLLWLPLLLGLSGTFRLLLRLLLGPL
jgi:hypothetical protein